ncbi:DUF2868 domain-containing protein [Thiobacillus denitrificans]|uniref:DUF2868 domain-containing protein n=1 Tax=Thiobacillus denitrificans TaxID=36861 RepID=UPI0003618291|nr:DUF2868 domain-containing protein [Thiobacillus denitrificans]
MREHSALEVLAVREIEIQDREGAIWTDADRAWASRTAAEIVGEKGEAENFVAKRATLLLERLADRNRVLPASIRGMHWQPWYGWTAVFAAGIMGIVVDRIGANHRIDLLAPPILALIGWNVLAYFIFLGSRMWRPGAHRVLGPLQRLTMRIVHFSSASGFLRSRAAFSTRDGAAIPGLANLTSAWFVLAHPLYVARVRRILHSAAIALALGVILGFYFRGFVSEYQATWESTFLDATVVHGVLAAILAPGAWLTGIAVPDLAHIQSIRAPSSENAANWLHLYAASIFLIVLVPRIGLALLAWGKERKLSENLQMPLDDRYFQVLLRGFHTVAERVRVVPFSYTLSEVARTGLESVLTRSFGGSVSVVFEPPVRWEHDESVVIHMARQGSEPVVALFNLAATPEEDVHGAFLDALRKHYGTGHNLIGMVDGSEYLARWPGEDARLEKRCRIWSDVFASHRVPMVYVNLAAPDLQATESAIDRALASTEAQGHTS